MIRVNLLNTGPGEAQTRGEWLPREQRGAALGLIMLLVTALGVGGYWWYLAASRAATESSIAEAQAQLDKLKNAVTLLDRANARKAELNERLALIERLRIAKRGPLSLLVLDLDHFKRVNDAFGHQFGDSLLKEIGQVLRLNVRSTDVACRYGGEEFVVLLPGADVEAARARAERLRELVEQVGTAQAGRIFGPMTLSVGLAVFPDHAVSGRALLEAGLGRSIDDVAVGGAEGTDAVSVEARGRLRLIIPWVGEARLPVAARSVVSKERFRAGPDR